MKQFLAAIGMIFLTQTIVGLDVPYRSQTGNAGFPGEWLAGMSANARFAGLGHAATALKGSAASFSNPAGIAGEGAGETSFFLTPLFGEGSMQTLSASYSLSRRDVIGASILQIESGKAEKTNIFGESMGSFEESNMAFLLTYGRSVRPSIEGGLNLKGIRTSLAGASATAFGVDGGAQIRPFGHSFTVGLAAQNIIPPNPQYQSEKEKYPLIAKFGASLQFNLFKRFILLTSDASLIDPSGASALRWGTGLEFCPLYDEDLPLLFRFGINQREFTMGMGFSKGAMTIDYSVALHELGILHRIGLTIKYGLFSAMSAKRLKAEWASIEEKEAVLQRMKNTLDKERVLLDKDKYLKELRDKARNFLTLGNLEEAKKTVYEIFSINLNDAEGEALLQIIQKSKNRQAAQEQIADAFAYYILKRYEDVVELLSKGGEDIKNFQDAQILLSMSKAHIYIKEANYSKAKEQLLNVVKLDPNQEEASVLYQRVKDVLEINDFK